ALINGASFGQFTKPSRIIVSANAGDDVVRVATGISQSAELHGGAGNDVLIGSNGRDLLIGGAGIDPLAGRSHADIWIGGNTSLESDTTALGNIMKVWLGGSSFAKRSAAVQTGAGVTGNFSFSSTTITDDNRLDILEGGAGRDLAYASTLDVQLDEDP